MARVGIIANPAAAHDVRRISGYGSGVDNHEKIRIIRRILLGLQAVGIDEVLVMPDHYRLGQHAVARLPDLAHPPVVQPPTSS